MTALRIACLLTFFYSAQAYAADSYIRLTCEEEDKGADVLLDGDYKGKCPLDLTTKPGTHQLEVATKKEGKYKLVYSVELVLGAGVAQRVDMPKSPPYAQSPEWESFILRRTPFPALMRGVAAGSPVAKAELAANYLADGKGCQFLLLMPEDMHAAIKSWNGACKGGAGAGPGELIWSADGVAEYGRLSGNFVQGKIEGKGKQAFHNGEVFEGMFVGGQRRGQGVQLYSNGDRYEGEFRNGQMEGKGVLTSADGSRRTGKFERNKFIGPE